MLDVGARGLLLRAGRLHRWQPLRYADDTSALWQDLPSRHRLSSEPLTVSASIGSDRAAPTGSVGVSRTANGAGSGPGPEIGGKGLTMRSRILSMIVSGSRGRMMISGSTS